MPALQLGVPLASAFASGDGSRHGDRPYRAGTPRPVSQCVGRFRGSGCEHCKIARGTPKQFEQFRLELAEMTDIVPENGNVRAIRAPNGLGNRGRQLWGRFASKYELSDAETVVLQAACVQADMVARLEQEVAEAPLVLDGRDHPVLNPAVTALRLAQESLIRMIGRLDIPAEDDDDGGTFASRRARRAARARWDRQKRREGEIE